MSSCRQGETMNVPLPTAFSSRPAFLHLVYSALQLRQPPRLSRQDIPCEQPDSPGHSECRRETQKKPPMLFNKDRSDDEDENEKPAAPTQHRQDRQMKRRFSHWRAPCTG